MALGSMPSTWVRKVVQQSQGARYSAVVTWPRRMAAVGDAPDGARTGLLAVAAGAAVGTRGVPGSVATVAVPDLGSCRKHACLSWSEGSWSKPLLWGRRNPLCNDNLAFAQRAEPSGSARSVGKSACQRPCWRGTHSDSPRATPHLYRVSLFVKKRRTKLTPCRDGGETDAEPGKAPEILQTSRSRTPWAKATGVCPTPTSGRCDRLCGARPGSSSRAVEVE